MIVPANRLLLLVAIGIVPALTCVGLGGALGRFGLIATVVLAGVMLVDAAASQGRLDPMVVAAPPVVRAIVGHAFELMLRVRAQIPGRWPLRVAIETPPELQLVASPSPLVLVDTARIRWRLRALARGRFPVSRVCLETPSLLGLWAMRRELSLQAMVHCYPDLRRDRRQLALSTRTVQLGAFASAFAGRGRSFDRLRDYVVGDVLDDIHWRATAKRRRPITKLFQVERAQRVYVAVDMSRLSARPSPQQIPAEDLPLPLLERYINAALVLGSVAQAHGDYFGLVGFSDGIDQFAPAARGIAHYRACREAILEFGTRRVNADYRELFTFLATRVRRRSLVIVLTSVDDPALSEELVQCIQLVAERHVVVAAAVRPPGARPLYPARPVRVAAEVNDRLAGHLLHKRLQTTARQLSRRGVHFLTLEHADMVTSLVSSYRKLKRKQLV